MISFKDFLTEKAMNMKTYSRLATINNGTAMVGCEYEMLIPFSSDLHPETGVRESVDVDSLSFSEIEHLFEISGSTHRQIYRAFQQWIEDQQQNYADENYHRYLDTDAEDQEDAVKDAKEQAFDESEDALDLSKDDWIKDEFRWMHSFISNFDLEPQYGWDFDSRDSVFTSGTSDNNHFDETSENVMTHIKDLVHMGADIKSNYEDWTIVEDGSIVGGGTGIEVISPPQTVAKATNNIRKMFRFMSNYAETNSSTGFHINVSVPDIHNLNKVKLLMFLGEKHVLKLFDRLGNTFTKSQLQTLASSLNNVDELPTTVSAIEEHLLKSISVAKFSSVNFKKLTDGYIEFRIAGNSDYHKKTDEVISTVYRYVAALESACDPEADKQEYYKKLVKFVQSFTSDVEKRNVVGTNVEKYSPFERLVKYNPAIANDIVQSVGPLGHARKADAILDTFVKALMVYQRFKLTMTAKEALGFRKTFFKRNPEVFQTAFKNKTTVNNMADVSGSKIKDEALIKFVKRELTNIGVEV